MKGFTGFQEKSHSLTPIPEEFFLELLPEMDHLDELKLILFAFWRLSQQEGKYRFLLHSQLSKDPEIVKSFETSNRGKKIQEAIERAVARGVLLSVRQQGKEERIYFLNSARGRAAIKALESGKWTLDETSSPNLSKEEQPNCFRLYEQNIGPLTPIIADLLRDAEKEYSSEQVEKAIHVAAEKNARHWRYISAVLARWKKEGERERGVSSDDERKRYVKGEYADFVKH